ncbi:MAG: dTDP-4-dehydrorhamnose 3,5-epimerase [Cytophagales bacterium]
MELKTTEFDGLVEILPTIIPDERGEFLEAYNKKTFKEIGLDINFVQDNLSVSRRGVLRGLHFQNDPNQQGKLVSVIKGKILDVVVDIRKDSKTFGKYKSFLIDDIQRKILYVPEGFAHGFLALENTILTYKCTSNYNRAAESGIIWNDPDLNIEWGIDDPIISAKDKLLPRFETLRDS